MSKIVELSNAQVEIKDQVTWIQMQRVEATLAESAKIGPDGKPTGFDGNALVESKIKLMEMLVVKITQEEKEFTFNRNWLEQLSVEDGNKLTAALDEVTGKKV